MFINMSTVANMFKLPNPEKATDYIQLQRHIKDYLRKYEYPLLSITDFTEEVELNVSPAWEEKSRKEKSNLILTLGDVFIAKTRGIVDNYAKSFKKLWE